MALQKKIIAQPFTAGAPYMLISIYVRTPANGMQKETKSGNPDLTQTDSLGPQGDHVKGCPIEACGCFASWGSSDHDWHDSTWAEIISAHNRFLSLNCGMIPEGKMSSAAVLCLLYRCCGWLFLE